MATDGGGWALTGSTRVAAVIGHPVRHSLSPVLHNAAFRALGLDWAYLAFDVADGRAPEALAAMRVLGIDGLSVTMPHKTATARAVDRCTDDAARLDAVNCVVREGDDLIGHNTDGPGFLAALHEETGTDVAGRRCVVLGAGGAARAVVCSLAGAGAAEVVVVNRTPARGEVAARLAGGRGRTAVPGTDEAGAALTEADLVVNATPVGMAGAGAGSGLPFDPGLLHRGQIVADLVYEPLETALVAEARRRGLTAVNGLGMLVHQAAIAFTAWTGEAAPVAVMRAAAQQHLG